MPGRMAPLKKPRSTKKLPLALNPTKSKDVLAVLAERTQAIVPVGAWVEPASPNCSEIPAHASAYMIEEELKEKQRRKQESLKHFQRQVKHRVNQQVKLRKKQQLQRSYKAVEKEGSIVMQCSDSAQLTPKRTSVFSSNLNAIGSSRLPPSQVLEDAVEDGENQNQLFQQAQALSQTMKQARHQLASFKTVSEEKASVFLNGRRKSSPTQEKAPPRKPTCVNINKETREESPLKIQEDPLNTVHYRNFMENQNLGYEKISSVMTDDKRREDLFVQYQQDLLSEDKDKPFSKIQKVKFKNPLFVVIKEEEQKQLNLQRIQAILPGAEDYLLEVQGDLPGPQSDVIDVQNVEFKASIEPKSPGVEPDSQVLEVQTVEPEGLASKTQDISLRTQASELDGHIQLEAQDLLPSNHFLSRDQDFLAKCQDQDSLPKDHCILRTYWTSLPKYQELTFVPVDQEFPPRNQPVFPREQSNLLKCQNQDFLPKDQNLLLKDYCAFPQNQIILFKYQDQDFLPKDQNFLPKHQCILPIYEDQDFLLEEEDFLTGDQHLLSKDQTVFPKCQHQYILSKDQNNLFKCKEHYLPPQNQNTSMKQPASILRCEQGRKDLPLDAHQDFLCCHHHQSLYFRQQPSVRTDERWQEDLHLGGLQHLPHRHVRDTCSWRQVYDEYQTGLDTGFQAFLAFQSGVDQEEDKKERQKQFLRHRRLFMDIEREQVKEQKRQKEQKKKIEKIKKKKEQQRYAEEQRILRMNLREEPYSGEKISNIFAQLQLEEIKGAREKQQQREKEYARYVEALRAQVQEKMKLYNITLPPLCCCGPDFWDAHPDTCANNCIFYKNYRAYNRALHSVISSSDISEGNSTLRNAIRNFASAHRRTSKKAKECQQSAVSLYAKSRQLEAKWMSTTVSADPASQSTT
ncbi:coiled-coil domain-containing protein 15 isoform X2 [Nannospalax galili]|uniref:coiled-coil domain-containing protein 15 isoform X2 n=1 Tax=Nannospalax galili TaxID=1026970 RepID=UPI000819D797|nr:coiled-coil domain-containing protein 15 isoform X2 [Nannospalax galili]